jgi:type IV pilus assembly protein PilV
LHARVAVMEMESYQRAQALSLLEDMENRIRGMRGLTAGLPAAGTTITVGPGGTSGYNPVGSCSGTGSTLLSCINSYCDAKPAQPGPPPVAAIPARTGADLEICQWSVALAGASEGATGSSETLGAMTGARGCISSVTPVVPVAGQEPAVAEYYVTVVWQGLVATANPPSNSYGSTCASSIDFGEGLRRYATTRILVPNLCALGFKYSPTGCVPI